MSDILAVTAIVRDGFFYHYCNTPNAWMALRIHHKGCPFCELKNPDYTPNKQVYTVSNFKNSSPILIFDSWDKATRYIQDHPNDSLMLGDTGYVN